jgi:hypothetical protein
MLKTVSQEVKQKRLAMCETCAEFRPTVKVCKKCGCFMPAKASFAKVYCPVGRWGQSSPGDSLINKIEEQILESWNNQ